MRSAPKKELRTDEEARSCDVCGRTILKGERTETFFAPGGKRKTVCELCVPRADHEGWIRESAHHELPAARAQRPPRRSFVGRIREAFAREEDPAGASLEADFAAEVAPAPEPEPPRERSERHERRERDREREREREMVPRRHRDARHVRAVPTTAEVKVERALELFNASEHPRTIAGIARTLGTPWVHTSPDGGQPSEVTIVVAWELSWYRYRIDLGDEHEPILLLEKGDELSELEEPLRAWNATADEFGGLSVDVGSEP